MADEHQPADQAVLDGLRNRPLGGSVVSVGWDGARRENERYDYKASMLSRQDDHERGEQQLQQYESGGTEDFVEDEPASSRRSGVQQGQQQPPREAPEMTPASLTATNDDLDQEKARKQQAAKNKKICLIVSAVVILVVVVVVIVVVLVGGSDSDDSSTNANTNQAGNPTTTTTPQPTPAPVPAPPTGTAAPTVALENLDIQVHFEALSFWLVQYGYSYESCQVTDDGPPKLTVSTDSTEYFVQLQGQSEHGTGNVVCDQIARNEVTCYADQDSSNVTAFTAMLLFATASMANSDPCSEIQVDMAPTQVQNCGVSAKIRTAVTLGHVCFPNHVATNFDDLEYQTQASGRCSALLSEITTPNTLDTTISGFKLHRICSGLGGSVNRQETGAVVASEGSDLPYCHLSRDDTAAQPFQWNSQAMWTLADNHLYFPDFLWYIVDPN